jgi:hypothetical protein
MRKAKHDKHLILKQLEKYPNMEAACQKVGVSHATVYRWIQTDKLFADAVNVAKSIGNSTMRDVAENNVMQGLKDNDQKYTLYYLNKRHPDYKKQEQINPHAQVNFTAEDAIKVAEQNILNRIASGDLESSKYFLSHNEQRYASPMRFQMLEERRRKDEEAALNIFSEKQFKGFETMMMRFAGARREKAFMEKHGIIPDSEDVFERLEEATEKERVERLAKDLDNNPV